MTAKPKRKRAKFTNNAKVTLTALTVISFVGGWDLIARLDNQDAQASSPPPTTLQNLSPSPTPLPTIAPLPTLPPIPTLPPNQTASQNVDFTQSNAANSAPVIQNPAAVQLAPVPTLAPLPELAPLPPMPQLPPPPAPTWNGGGGNHSGGS